MNFIAAIRTGLKIRRPSWKPEAYLRVNNNCIVTDEDSFWEPNLTDVIADDWDYSTLSFEEAMEHFKKGKAVKRKDWAIWATNIISLAPADMQAKDWRIR